MSTVFALQSGSMNVSLLNDINKSFKDGAVAVVRTTIEYLNVLQQPYAVHLVFITKQITPHIPNLPGMAQKIANLISEEKPKYVINAVYTDIFLGQKVATIVIFYLNQAYVDAGITKKAVSEALSEFVSM